MAPAAAISDPPLVLRRRGRVAVAVGTVFLVFPLGHLLGGDATQTQKVAGVAGVALFLALYLHYMIGWGANWPPVPASVASLTGLVAIATALVLVGGVDWSALWVYVAAAAGFHLPQPWGIAGVFSCAAVAGVVGLTAGETGGDAMGTVIGCLSVGMLVGGFRRLREANQEIIAARERIERLAVADERLRFARDLHDLLGHSLSVVAVKSELAGRLLPEHPEAAAGHVHDIEEVSRRALAEVRQAVSGYRRPRLDAELAGAQAALGSAGVEVDIDPPPPALDPEVEEVLAWTVREGTTNVLRHADEARRVRIALARDDGATRIEIDDDGRRDVAPNGRGSGLAGLRERVERVNGTLEAGPHGGHGYRLAVRVPA